MPPLTGQPNAAVVGSRALAQRTPHRGMVTACIICATLLQSLDQTIANVKLPYMQGSFSASYDEIAWVLTSHITAAVIMTAPVGWLAGRFGRKRLGHAMLNRRRGCTRPNEALRSLRVSNPVPWLPRECRTPGPIRSAQPRPARH
jgi:hypothetical protein